MIILSAVAAIVFIIVTIVFSILSVFVALLDRSGNAYLWVARMWARCALLLFGIRVTVKGTHHIKKGQNYVYAANHSRYMDIPILLGYIPDNLRLMLRNTLTRIPIWGWALLIGPFIIVDRSNAKKAEGSIRVAIDRIRKGASVLIFPEGTRTSTGEMQSFKRGAFHLAREAGAPILPVAVIGAFEILPRHRFLPRWGMKAELRIGEAVYPMGVPPEGHRSEEIRLMKESEDRTRALLSV